MDCDDGDAQVNPDAAEVCNDIDDDCNDLVDDGSGAPQCPLSCAPPGDAGCETPVALRGGTGHMCTLTDAGTVYCWGDNRYGQVADQSLFAATRPIKITAIEGATDLDAGDDQTCAVVGTKAYCWGRDSVYPYEHVLPAETQDIAVTEASLCSLTSDGAVICYEKLDTDVLLPDTETIRVASGAVEIDAQGGKTCARIDDGSVKCWVALDEEADIDTPLTEGALDVRVYGSAGCSRTAGGLYCWEFSGEASKVPGMDTSVGAAVGWNLRCAYSSDGKLGCWKGAGPSNILGIVELEAASSHICALSEDGEIQCFGDAIYGKLGNGEIDGEDTASAVPVLFPAGSSSTTHSVLTAGSTAACDNAADLIAMIDGSKEGVISALVDCRETCDGALDPDACFIDCRTMNATGLSSACVQCFEDFVNTAASDLMSAYTTRDTCAGYKVDFVRKHDIIFSYEDPRDKAAGEPCSSNGQCISNNCGVPSLYQEIGAGYVCLARVGSLYDRGQCQRSNTQGSTAICSRDCSSGTLCPDGYECLGNSTTGDFWCRESCDYDRQFADEFACRLGSCELSSGTGAVFYCR